MWVRLLKADKDLNVPIGQALRVTRSYGKSLIKAKKAKEYTGEFPVKKMKTDLFKPK